MSFTVASGHELNTQHVCGKSAFASKVVVADCPLCSSRWCGYLAVAVALASTVLPASVHWTDRARGVRQFEQEVGRPWDINEALAKL